MEIKELPKEVSELISEKIKSPIYGPFLTIFILHNWKIFIGLFIPRDMLVKEGFQTYFELISKSYKILEPILWTILIILIYPWANQVVKKWNKLSVDVIEDIRLKLKVYRKSAYTKIEYDSMVNSYSNQIEYFKTELNKLGQIQIKNSELNSQIETIEKYNSQVFLNGTWQSNKSFLNSGFQGENLYNINNYSISYVDTELNVNRPVGDIIIQSYNTYNKFLFLTILMKGTRQTSIYKCTLFNVDNTLSVVNMNQDGTFDENNAITLNRIK
jgi:hypothetical protein